MAKAVLKDVLEIHSSKEILKPTLISERAVESRKDQLLNAQESSVFRADPRHTHSFNAIPRNHKRLQQAYLGGEVNAAGHIYNPDLKAVRPKVRGAVSISTRQTKARAAGGRPPACLDEKLAVTT